MSYERILIVYQLQTDVFPLKYAGLGCGKSRLIYDPCLTVNGCLRAVLVHRYIFRTRIKMVGSVHDAVYDRDIGH